MPPQGCPSKEMLLSIVCKSIIRDKNRCIIAKKVKFSEARVTKPPNKAPEVLSIVVIIDRKIIFKNGKPNTCWINDSMIERAPAIY